MTAKRRAASSKVKLLSREPAVVFFARATIKQLTRGMKKVSGGSLGRFGSPPCLRSWRRGRWHLRVRVSEQ
jgi:hypothetical protein